MMIEFNVIHAAYINDIKKLLFIGSSCIYPKYAEQPIKEENILTGSLEPINEPYAIAKISGLDMCDYYRRQYGCDFISAMPTNLYGLNDNFNLETSHALPAILRKMHLAKCLENDDWDSIRKDLDKRPIVIINGKSSDEAIIKILSKYGISIIQNPKLKIQHSANVSLTLWGSGSPYR